MPWKDIWPRVWVAVGLPQARHRLYMVACINRSQGRNGLLHPHRLGTYPLTGSSSALTKSIKRSVLARLPYSRQGAR
jgi:hypothetical protein